MLLRQSTAQTVIIGPVLDSTGAAVTTAVVTNFSLAKNGTAAALTTETLTHLGNGYYSLALTISNTNTTGVLAAFPNATTMSMTVFRWNVISASVYDAIVTNATNTSGGLLTATSAVSAISGALLNTTNLPSNFGSLAITAGGAVTAGTVSDKTGYSLTQNFPSNFAALAIDVSGKVLLQATQTGVTIPTVTTVSGFATDSITAAALATDAVAEIQSGLSTLTQANVRTAVGLASANLDTQLAAIPSAATTSTAVWANATRTITGGTVDTLTNSPNVPSASAIASAVRTELTPELNQLDTIQAKTDLIGTGSATVSAPVTASGEITEIVIGDDYLSSNSRTFDWTVDLPVGFTAGQTSCYFGGQMDRANKWLVQGAVTNVGGGKIKLSFELAKTVTEKLLPGAYDWSVEVRDSNGVEITRVRTKTTSAALVYKQT